MPDFSKRSDDPEWMDTECADFEDYRACLADLAQLNRLTLTHRPTIAFLDRLRRQGRLPTGRPLAVLDIASGYGDLLRTIAAWAARHRIAVALTGLDLNPDAARAAMTVTPPGMLIEWVTGDLFTHRPPTPVDIVTSTQFAHHLDDKTVGRLLSWMEATAGIGWLITDLQRHRIAYHAFPLIARAAGWHRFVRHDGAVSIRRSLRLAEWRALIKNAGFAGQAKLQWQLPFRLTVERVKPA